MIKTIPHPDYVSQSWDKYNDLALIKLAKEAPFTDYIRHICLPGYYNMTEQVELATASKFVVAGWGHTDYCEYSLSTFRKLVSTQNSFQRIQIKPLTAFPARSS